MTKEKLLQQLKYTQKKHQNDHTDTFGTNISLMCGDIVNVLNRCVEMPEEVTNGEVIQKMFPDVKVEGCNKDVEGNPHLYRIHGLDGVTDFTANWWNSKWGE